MADAVLVSSSFLPGRGGIESYLAELCDSLSPRLAVLAAGQREGKRLPGDLGYGVHPFDGRLLMPGRSALQATVAAARAEGTDKILFGTPWPLLLLGPRLRARGVRYATIVHGAELTVPGAVPGLGRRVAQALAGAELILPVSAYTADQVHRLVERHGLDAPPTELLRARVDLERFSPDPRPPDAPDRWGFPPDSRVVLCLGRLVRRKGVDRLIEAVALVAEQVPEVVLMVAGTGRDERRLRRLAARSSARVIFGGRVPDEEAPDLYRTADVFALAVADRWFGLEIEGLGVVLLEAAASGTPCVTGRSGGTPEAVIDGVTGFVTDGKDPRALSGAIARILADKGLAAEMGARGREHVMSEFSERQIPGSLLRWLDA